MSGRRTRGETPRKQENPKPPRPNKKKRKKREQSRIEGEIQNPPLRDTAGETCMQAILSLLDLYSPTVTEYSPSEEATSGVYTVYDTSPSHTFPELRQTEQLSFQPDHLQSSETTATRQGPAWLQPQVFKPQTPVLYTIKTCHPTTPISRQAMMRHRPARIHPHTTTGKKPCLTPRASRRPQSPAI